MGRLVCEVHHANVSEDGLTVMARSLAVTDALGAKHGGRHQVFNHAQPTERLDYLKRARDASMADLIGPQADDRLPKKPNVPASSLSDLTG